MLNKKLETALNEQINAEFWSAYFYLSMSADFAAKGMTGFANWMHIQFREEQDHALKIMNYMLSRNSRPELKPIAKVPTQWESPLKAFEDTLKHEQEVTAMINKLYAIASEQKDYATLSMLKWFVDEQVEEEATAQSLIDALRMIKDNGFGIYTLDRELRARTYSPIADE